MSDILTNDTESMSGKDAIDFVAEHFGVPSMYAMSKALSDENLTVQPIQISRYRKGHKMSSKVANRFFDTYGVVINDYYKKGVWQS